LVATTERAAQARRDEWRAAGAEVLDLDQAPGGCSLNALLADLGKRDVQAVLLEGGPTLAWSAVADGIVDKLVLYLAPRLAGGAGALGILGGEGFAPIASAARVRIASVEHIGEDIKVEAYVHRDH
jgi:diaminohydroxyphosphoribosylaminopyrimidine deaminase/5-amino-6-(5-phosphoribosylamino)uracil reductase